MENTTAPEARMTKTEIKEEAKQLVLSSGPSTILEFGEEIIQRNTTLNGEDAALVLAEAVNQAHRVYAFLGYDAPWAKGVA